MAQKDRVSALLNQLRQGSPEGLPLPNVLDESGVNFMVRAALSMAPTHEGKEGILRNLGFEPRQTSDGHLGVVKDGKIFPVDPGNFEVGDIADLAGDFIPAATSTLGGIAGTSLGAAGFGIGAAPGGMVGAAGGGLLGEMGRQKIGQALGSGQPINEDNLKVEAFTAPLGEIGGRLVGAGLKKGLAPFKANTELMTKAGDVDAKLGTSIKGNLPLAAQTRSDLLAGAEQRVSESAVTADQFRQQVSEPLQKEFQGGLDVIRAQKKHLSQDVGDALQEGAVETLKAREGEVAALYKKLRKLLPGEAPAEAINAAEAIARIADRTGADALSGFNIAGAQKKQLADLQKDIFNIRTFDELDAYRKQIGSLLSSQGGLEQFKNSGLDGHIRDLYGALLEDGMEVGRRHGFADAARSASAAAKDLINLDKTSAARLLRDPDKAANIVDQLARPNQARVIQQFKRKVGANTSESGLTATGFGREAWDMAGDALMVKLRAQATDPASGHFSGTRLLSAIQRAGGPEVLVEFFGRDATDTIMDFAKLAQDTNVSERLFKNFSNTGKANEFQTLASSGQRGMTGLLGALGQIGATHGLGKAVLSPGGRKFLTQGLATGPGGQNILSVLGRLPVQQARTTGERSFGLKR